MKPDDILATFKKLWKGTDAELSDAVWLLIDDLLDVVRTARDDGGDELSELQDYVAHHYGDD